MDGAALIPVWMIGSVVPGSNSMDRAYKEDIPKYRKTLEELRKGFSGISTKTDWVALRVDPLLEHVRSLERMLKSPKFKRETARLRRGVAMFHADLVHLRTNIAALKQILADETRRLATPKRGGKTSCLQK